MTKIFHPLLALIASSTNNELAKYVEYLKHENKILRARLPKQVHTTAEERQTLIKFGKTVGRAIEELITIASPATFYRWVREAKNGKPAPKNPKGGQRKPKEIRELVLKIAEETGFGLTRIVGELRKLGITKISRQTVRNILKEAGIEPSPDRTSDSWADFLARHGETLWGCDFFSVKSVTAKGIRDLYVMVFLCLQTRELIVTESTEHPDSAWVCEQTKLFAARTKDREKKPEMIIHDRDVKYTKEFTAIVKAYGMKTNPLPKGSPNLNGRSKTTWKTFIKAHWDVLAAIDFTTVEVWTKGGLVTFYLLFVMELKTRSVHFAGCTMTLGDDFMKQIARNLTDPFDGFLNGKSQLLMDRDANFSAAFRTILAEAGVTPVRLPPQSPNLNAQLERFHLSLKSESLSRMIFFGESALRNAVGQYLDHFHRERNHQGLNNQIINAGDEVGCTTGKVQCSERLGGLLKYYHRQAA